MFDIYKRGQGRHTRIITFAGVMLLALIGAVVLSNELGAVDSRHKVYLQYGIPTVLVLGGALLMFHLMNRRRTADFLIATEGEMKKVSWSSKKEVIGSTKVVIIMTFIMAGLLFGVDLLFSELFDVMGVMTRAPASP